jgi:transposase
VLRLDHIRDLDTMRHVAVLLERENDRLHAKLHTLTRELSQLRGEDAGAAQRQLEALKEILAHREHALFGASSEKRAQPAPAHQPPLQHRSGATARRPSPRCPSWTWCTSWPPRIASAPPAAACCAR